MKKTVFLRKATLDDFPVFYKYHLESSWHWLTNIDETEESNTFILDKSDVLLSTIDMEKVQQFYIDFNQQDFEDYLRWYKIYMVMANSEPVGYVILYYFCSKLVIREWPMLPEYQTPDFLSNVLKEIEAQKTKTTKKYQICSCNRVSNDFLMNHGYIQSGVNIFFEKEVKK